MSGVNKVILVGHLGADPTVRSTQTGTAVCNFNLATTERFKDKSGERQERTEWHRVVTFARLAEICAPALLLATSTTSPSTPCRSRRRGRC